MANVLIDTQEARLRGRALRTKMVTGTSSKAWSICGARVMVLFHGLRLRETLRAHPLEQSQGALPRQTTPDETRKTIFTISA